MKKLLLTFMLLLALPCWAEVRVVDGDSLEEDGVRIRLDGIDAPEFFQICQDARGNDYECGQEAKQHLADLIGEYNMRCECLPKPDKYNRKTCECFAGGFSLNRTMVQDGYARIYRSKRFAAEEEEAKLHHRGIWRGKNMRPALYRILQTVEE